MLSVTSRMKSLPAMSETAPVWISRKYVVPPGLGVNATSSQGSRSLFPQIWIFGSSHAMVFSMT